MYSTDHWNIFKKEYLRVFFKQKKSLVIILLIGILQAALLIASPFLIQDIITITNGTKSDRSTLSLSIILLCCSFIIQAGSIYAINWKSRHLSIQVEIDLRKDMIEKLHRLSMLQIDKTPGSNPQSGT